MVNIQSVLDNPQQVLQYLKGIDLNTSIVFIAGSLMEGFGNLTSDIDVYVIYEQSMKGIKKDSFASSDDLVITEEQYMTRNAILDGIRYDFEYWKYDTFYQAINRLNNMIPKSDDFLETIIPAKEFDLLHRLKFAKPINNQEKFYGIMKGIHFDNIDFYWAALGFTYYNGRLEDVKGALMSGDSGSAFFIARILLDYMVTSYVAVFGETNPNSKWLYRKMERYQQKTGDESLINTYIHLQTHPFESSNVKSYVKNVIQYCQQLNIKVQEMLNKKQAI